MYEARLAAIAAAARVGELSFEDHALFEMQVDGYTVPDVMDALAGDAVVVEDYRVTERPEGRPAMLVLGWVGARPIHIVVTYPPYPSVVTVWDPSARPQQWSADFRRRVR